MTKRLKELRELFKWVDIGTRVIVKGKQPKRVSRKHRSPFYITKYFYKRYNTSYKKERKYLAKLNRELKRLSKTHHIAMAKKNAKLKRRLAISKSEKLKRAKLKKQRKKSIYKRRIASKKSNLIRYYSKFSYKKLNQILKDNYNKKRKILASKISKRDKIRKLKRVTRVLKIIKAAKYTKKHKRYKKKVA